LPFVDDVSTGLWQTDVAARIVTRSTRGRRILATRGRLQARDAKLADRPRLEGGRQQGAHSTEERPHVLDLALESGAVTGGAVGARSRVAMYRVGVAAGHARRTVSPHAITSAVQA
jgi:hypothetical protein